MDGQADQSRARQSARQVPICYLGRFFYSWGENEIDVPPGPVRVEVWKGLEYLPASMSVLIAKDETRKSR